MSSLAVIPADAFTNSAGIVLQPKPDANAGAVLLFVLLSRLDAAVVNFGELTAYPSPVHSDPDTLNFGASFVLWDNLWGTNYIMWWPFIVPPPAPYGSSSAYFPSSWNNDMISRFQMIFGRHKGENHPIWV